MTGGCQQVFQSLHLGIKHPFELVNGFINDQAIFQHAGAMDDTGDGTVQIADVGHDVLNHGDITNISLIIVCFCSG